MSGHESELPPKLSGAEILYGPSGRPPEPSAEPKYEAYDLRYPDTGGEIQVDDTYLTSLLAEVMSSWDGDPANRARLIAEMRRASEGREDLFISAEAGEARGILSAAEVVDALSAAAAHGAERPQFVEPVEVGVEKADPEAPELPEAVRDRLDGYIRHLAELERDRPDRQVYLEAATRLMGLRTLAEQVQTDPLMVPEDINDLHPHIERLLDRIDAATEKASSTAEQAQRVRGWVKQVAEVPQPDDETQLEDRLDRLRELQADALADLGEQAAEMPGGEGLLKTLSRLISEAERQVATRDARAKVAVATQAPAAPDAGGGQPGTPEAQPAPEAEPDYEVLKAEYAPQIAAARRFDQLGAVAEAAAQAGLLRRVEVPEEEKPVSLGQRYAPVEGQSASEGIHEQFLWQGEDISSYRVLHGYMGPLKPGELEAGLEPELDEVKRAFEPSTMHGHEDFDWTRERVAAVLATEPSARTARALAKQLIIESQLGMVDADGKSRRDMLFAGEPVRFELISDDPEAAVDRPLLRRLRQALKRPDPDKVTESQEAESAATRRGDLSIVFRAPGEGDGSTSEPSPEAGGRITTFEGAHTALARLEDRFETGESLRDLRDVLGRIETAVLNQQLIQGVPGEPRPLMQDGVEEPHSAGLVLRMQQLRGEMLRRANNNAAAEDGSGGTSPAGEVGAPDGVVPLRGSAASPDSTPEGDEQRRFNS